MDKENRFIANDLFPFLMNHNALPRFPHAPHGKASRLDWHVVIQRLSQEGMASIFYYQLKKRGCDHLLPPACLEMLAERFHTSIVRNMSTLGRVKPVFLALRKSGIAVAVLKGLFFIEHLYPHPAIREASDVDILIHAEDIFPVDEQLRTMGYEAKDSLPEIAIKNPSGYLASLDYVHSLHPTLHIHVHWHLVNTSVPAYMFTSRMPMDLIWGKIMPARIADTDVSILCFEHALIYLCEHALRVGHSFDRLVLVYDIYLFWKCFGVRIDWELLLCECRRMHLESFLFLGLSVVETYTGPVMPENIRHALWSNVRLRLGERIFLSLYKRKFRFRGASYLLYLSLNDTWMAKGRYLFRTLFPPAAILRQRRYEKSIDGAHGKLSLYVQHISEILHYLWSLKSVLFNIKP